jgi:NitT/TauT family transport system substrate-binding protein
MIRAIARGHIEAWRDPDAAIAALLRRDATAPAALERERLVANFEFIRTPDVLSGGFGNLPAARVQGAIDTIRTAFDIAAPMSAGDLYLPGFMPPADSIRFPAAAG